MTSQIDGVVARLKGTIAGVLNYSTVDLIREGTAGELKFSECSHTFDNIFRLFQDLQESDLSAMPLSALEEIQRQAESAITLFARISRFSLMDQNPSQTRNGLVVELDGLWSQLFQSVAPKLSYLRKVGSDVPTLFRELQSQLAAAELMLKSATEEKNSILADMRVALASAKDIAADVAVARHSGNFASEADGHQESAKRWLIASACFGMAMILASFVYLRVDQLVVANGNLSDAVRSLLPRLTLLIVLGFALVWSSRNYSAAKHNEIVNRHRQNALSTFETFVRSAHDPDTKNAVLLQTTQSIFAPQETAFSRGDVPTGPAPQIIEIVRSLSPNRLN